MSATIENLDKEALEIDTKLWTIEQQRKKLDREILHLEFSSQGIEGTWADKRRAAARVRNQQVLHDIEYFEAKMRTRKLSSPLTPLRKELLERYIQECVLTT